MKHKNETLPKTALQDPIHQWRWLMSGREQHKSLRNAEESHKRIFSGFYKRWRIQVTNYQWRHLWMSPESHFLPHDPLKSTSHPQDSFLSPTTKYFNSRPKQ